MPWPGEKSIGSVSSTKRPWTKVLIRFPELVLESLKKVIAIRITVNNQTKVINKNICFVVNLRVSDRDSKSQCDEMIKYMNETSSVRTNETYGRKILNQQPHHYK